MIIFDEYSFIVKILRENHVEKMGVKRLITYIARYYYAENRGLSGGKLCQMVAARMAEFKFTPDYYQEHKYNNFIKSQCLKIVKGKIPSELNVAREVVITKPEMDAVHSAPSENARKLLFTLYVLAKIRVNHTGWINYGIKDIFECADVSVSNQEKYYLLNDLYVAGLIELNHSVKKNGYKVELIDGEPEMIVSDFQHFGRQYIAAYKEGWTLCLSCGKLIKDTVGRGRPTKYCRTCAAEIKKIQDGNIELIQNHPKIFSS